MTQIAEPDSHARPVSADPRLPSPRASLPSGTPWPALVTLVAGDAVIALVLWDVPGILRMVSVLGYLAVAPGLACARLIRIPDGLTRFVVGVALSLALGILVAQGMIHLHLWSPLLGILTLTVIASLVALIELVRSVRQHRRKRWMEAG
ncbi:hypothetical protein [Micromonospora sp. NPDC093277]|uniref:hypothetical protein n=1 Tax=Micromonospora sp. NPDC093277 TaxID=3364291 RepID=UPI0037FE53E7